MATDLKTQYRHKLERLLADIEHVRYLLEGLHSRVRNELAEGGEFGSSNVNSLGELQNWGTRVDMRCVEIALLRNLIGEKDD